MDRPLRLLYLGDTSSPHLRAWPEHFVRRGHDVHVCHLSRRPPGEPIRGVTMHPPPRPASSGLRGAWIASAFGIRRLRRRIRPDITHSHQLVPTGYVAALAGAHPHVATAWGSEVLLTDGLSRRLMATAARRADLVTADSHHVLSVLEGIGADPARLRWVPWGVSNAWRSPALELTPSAAAERLGLPAGRTIVLSHRGTVPLYRQDVFVRAVASLADRFPDVLGVVIASDPVTAPAGEARVRALAEELGAEGSILHIPRFPHELMPFAYRAAAVCVSVPESDSAPTSVFEAISMGTPAIVSDLPWVHEPIHNEAKLSVVPVGNDRDLAEAIASALSHPQETATNSAHNIALVERSFERGALFASLEREYERLARM